MPRRPDAVTVSAEDLEYVWQQIKLSHKYHQPFVKKGRECVEYREGRRFTSFVAEEFDDSHGPSRIGRVPINLFQTYFEILRPMLTGKTWRPIASTAFSMFYDAAQREEDMIAWNQKVTDFDSEVQMTAIDRIDYGRGVIKSGIGEPFGMRAIDAALSAPTVDPMTGRVTTIGEVVRETVSAANGKASEPEDHPSQGGRRYPKGAVWQQRVSPEDVWTDYAARTPADSRYMNQQHFLPKRTMIKVLKRLRLPSNTVERLTPYGFSMSFEYLEQELDKRRGPMWAKLKAQAEQEEFYKIHEFWWREEAKLLFLVDGMEERVLLARKWGAPDGEYPFEFFDRPTRGDRAHPEPELQGLQPDQDQVNVANSILTDVVRRARAIVGVLEQFVNPDDLKNIAEGGPLAIVRLRTQIEKALQVVQIQQDVKQLQDLIVHIEGSSRRRHGITLEQLGAPSNTPTATQNLIMDQSAKLLQDDRGKGMHEFLGRCVAKHSRYNRLAQPQWGEAPGRPGASIYEGAMGLPRGDREAYYPMEQGFTREELLYEKRWTLEVIAQSPSERDEQLQRAIEIANIIGKTGALNWWEWGRYVWELAQVNRRGLMNPDPEDRDPMEEHADILAGVPINQSPYENHARHFQKHKQFIVEVIQLVKMKTEGRPQPPQFVVTPIHFEYVKDVLERGGQKFQILMQHAQITEKLAGGGGGAGGQMQSMSQGGAMDTNRARESMGKKNVRAEAGKPIPFGAQNTNLGRMAGAR